MRRRALQMTMGAVAVAVVLLGIPLGGAWMVLAFRTTLAPEDRAQVVLTVVLTVIILTLVALAAGRPDADGIATVDLTVLPASGAADAGAVCARVMIGLMGVDGIGAVALTLRVREGA